MKNSTFKGLVAFTLLTLCGTAASAEMDLGRFEYMNSCAQCHGVDGKGDGPVSAYLHTLPPDLTTMTERNDGVFPVRWARSIIDGSADIAVHGGRDMPVWGDRFVERALTDAEVAGSMQQAQAFSNARILALIEYLVLMQSP